MQNIFQICLSNSLVALVLAVVATAVAAIGRRPALVHALWVLALIKLVTPPLVPVPLSSAMLKLRLSSRTAHSTEPRVYYTWSCWDGIGARADPISVREKLPADPASAQARAKVAAEQSARRAKLAAKAAATVTIPPPRALTIPERTTTATLLARPGDLLKRFATTTPSSSQAWALASWLGIALLWWSLTVLRLRKFRRLLRSAARASAELQDQTRGLAARLGLRRVPEVWLVPSAIPPMLWALGTRPRLLVPSALLARLGTDQRASLLVHELAHMKRRDHWIRVLEIAVTGLHWWNPLVWWSKRALREAEEQCCDAWVAWALPGSARSYATTILETVDYLADAPNLEHLAGTALTSATHLRRRLIQILSGSARKHLSRTAIMTLVGLTLVVLAMGPSYPSRRFFRAMELGSLGGGWTEPLKLNERGQVIGRSRLNEFPPIDTRSKTHCFRTAPGRPINRATDDLDVVLGLSYVPKFGVHASAINNSGQVVLHCLQPRSPELRVFRDIQRGFLIDARRVIELDPDVSPKPVAINDAGQVAGIAIRERVLPVDARPRDTPTATRLYDEVGFRTLPSQPLDLARDDIGHLGERPHYLTSDSLHVIRISGMNALGQVVGDAVGHAFRSVPDRPFDPATDDLGALASSVSTQGKTSFDASTYAQDVNDLGQVVGLSNVREWCVRTNFHVDELGEVFGSDAYEDWSFHAFRTAPNRPIDPVTDDLGTLGGPQSLAHGINNQGDVVGASETADAQKLAFLFTDGRMIDLNECVDLEPGWILQSAYDINNLGCGQIIAVAVNSRDIKRRSQRAYLLSPAPEPGALVMLILATTVSCSGFALRFGRRFMGRIRLKLPVADSWSCARCKT